MSAASGWDEFFVSTEWLAAHLTDPAIRIIDVRGIILPVEAPQPWYLECRDEYADDHIPGALYVGWLTDLIEPDAPVKLTAASPQRFAALMARLGIGDDHLVVAYDDLGNQVAARLWWMLNACGHPAVRLVDGGYPKWLAEGRPVTAEPPRHPPGAFTARVQPEWWLRRAEVRQALHDPNVRLIDCRPRRDFRGEVGRGERKGHIPGALNIPTRQFMHGPYNTWKSEGDLGAIHEAAGVTPENRIITYCYSGVTASVGLLALKLLGFPRVANYVGSWYDWESDPTSPIEAG
jgi:thiosulfate/3-mercaptopyruvate sulfurtransferase